MAKRGSATGMVQMVGVSSFLTLCFSFMDCRIRTVPIPMPMPSNVKVAIPRKSTMSGDVSIFMGWSLTFPAMVEMSEIHDVEAEDDTRVPDEVFAIVGWQPCRIHTSGVSRRDMQQ